MIIASAAWHLRSIRSEEEFFAHLREFFEGAADEGATWLVLPELPILELLHLEPKLNDQDAVEFLLGFEETFEQMIGIYGRAFGVSVVGGSHFSQSDGIINVSVVFEGTGLRRQAKNKLTQFEQNDWNVSPGTGLCSLLDPRVGVLICYDCEFPEAGRALAENGVQALMVPAFTETRHGFDRVRYSCHARAIENQIFVVHSSLIGSLGREPVPSAYGSAAIIAPSHQPFPEGGILAQTPMNQEGLAIAELDFDALLESRETGDVRNWHDRSSATWKHPA